MANIKSAKKRIRVIEKKTGRNKRVKSRLREILKDFEAALAAGEQKTARDKLALAEKRLMQGVSKGTLHRNTASRKVSRITKAFIKAFGKEALLEKAELPAIPDKSEKKAKKEAKPAKQTTTQEVAQTEPEATEEIPSEEESADEKAPATVSTKKASVEEAEEAPAKEEAPEESEA
jgi:small subunit ribosomal protein S20